MSIISAGTSNTTSIVYTGDTTGNLVFQSNGTTEAMRITSAQQVGIGTSTPTQPLHVLGSALIGYGGYLLHYNIQCSQQTTTFDAIVYLIIGGLVIADLWLTSLLKRGKK